LLAHLLHAGNFSRALNVALWGRRCSACTTL
jgi:hypothetical protein